MLVSLRLCSTHTQDAVCHRADINSVLQMSAEFACLAFHKPFKLLFGDVVQKQNLVSWPYMLVKGLDRLAPNKPFVMHSDSVASEHRNMYPSRGSMTEHNSVAESFRTTQWVQ